MHGLHTVTLLYLNLLDMEELVGSLGGASVMIGSTALAEKCIKMKLGCVFPAWKMKCHLITICRK